MNLVDQVNELHKNPNVEKLPYFKAGDTVAVHAKITEGEKTRIQIFQGTVLGSKEAGNLNGHFRVRKISGGIGVERVFPYHSPNIEKVVVVSTGKTKRSKLFYLRDRTGKSARVATEYGRKEK